MGVRRKGGPEVSSDSEGGSPVDIIVQEDHDNTDQDDTELNLSRRGAAVPYPPAAGDGVPTSDGSPSSGYENNSNTDSGSSTAEGPTDHVNQIKGELLQGFTLVLYQFCPPRQNHNNTHLHPRVLRRKKMYCDPKTMA